jgi:flavin reductase (DIM6/NTAB) family NADH-FMN oxidoreductase RutF
VPRCIGWISSLALDGTVNLAPYSFFNGVGDNPPMVMFSSGGRHQHGEKDSQANVENTGEFVCNMVTWELREQMSLTSAPTRPEVNEFDYAGLEWEPSQVVKPPRVKGSPIHLECEYLQSVALPCNDPATSNSIIIGEVVGIHIRDCVLTNGMVDMCKFRPVARMGYMDYTVVDTVFTMLFPDSV